MSYRPKPHQVISAVLILLIGIARYNSCQPKRTNGCLNLSAIITASLVTPLIFILFSACLHQRHGEDSSREARLAILRHHAYTSRGHPIPPSFWDMPTPNLAVQVASWVDQRAEDCHEKLLRSACCRSQRR